MKYTIESFKEEFNISASEVVGFLGDLKESLSEEAYEICFNLSDIIYEEEFEGVNYNVGYRIVEEFSVGWKYHTGSEEYPLCLIDHIIKQLKEIK